MKKFLIMFALMMGMVSANAQIATENSNTLDNISFGVTGGLSTPLDFNSMFPLNTNVGVKFGKDVTPTLGFQVEGLAFLNDNHFATTKTFVKATNIGLNSVINLSNLFFGYKGTPRTFEMGAVGGIGWLHIWDTKKNYLTAKTGLDLSFNLGKEKANSIVLTPAVFWNLSKTKDVQFDKRFAQLGLSVSFIHHFKTSNGTRHFKLWDVGAMRDENIRLQSALDECNRRGPKVIERVIETVKVVGCDEWVVGFDFGKAELTNSAKFILDKVAENAVVDVIATASPEGTDEFNQKLSEQRAEVVAKYLTDRGVKVNGFVGKGVNPETGRAAVVKMTK